MSVLTASAFDLDKKISDAFVNLVSLHTRKRGGQGGRDRVPIDEQIDAISYLVCFLTTFAMEGFQRVQPLKVRLEEMARLVLDCCLRKREAVAKATFTRIQAQVFIEDIAEWTRAVISVGMHLRRFAANFPIPKEMGAVPLPGFSRTREWLHKAELKLIGVNED